MSADGSMDILYENEAFAAVQEVFFVRALPFITSQTILIGIRTGGDVLADRLAQYCQQELGYHPEVGYLDISLYRDDFAHSTHWPEVQQTQIDSSLEERDIVLIDEVLFTGRTIRAALDALLDLGRPSVVRLGVLFDRGLREFPIQADFVGEKVTLERGKSLLVELAPEVTRDRAISLIRRQEEN